MDSTPGLTELLLRRESLVLMVACWIFLDLLSRLLPKAIKDAPLTVRLAPLYPLIVCEAAIWCPGFFTDIRGAEKAMVGLVLGWASAHVYKTFMQGILGRDRRVRPLEAPNDMGPPDDPPDESVRPSRISTAKLPPMGDG